MVAIATLTENGHNHTIRGCLGCTVDGSCGYSCSGIARFCNSISLMGTMYVTEMDLCEYYSHPSNPLNPSNE